MRLRPCGLLLSCACEIVLLAANNVPWQTKNFKDWTHEDARAVMTDSPWAKRVPMPSGGRPTVTVIEPGSNVNAPPSASLGNPANSTTGVNMSVPSIGGSNGPAESNGTHNLPATPTPSGVVANTGAPALPSSLTIIWASATPVRLAVLKLRSGPNIPTDNDISRMSRPRQNYVIAVVGLPAPEAGSDPKALATSAYLTTRDRPALRAIDSDYKRIGNSDVYFFGFSRASLPLSEADREVEFKMAMGKIEIKKKFELADMQYKGQLAL
jgi:hypothetical protein